VPAAGQPVAKVVPDKPPTSRNASLTRPCLLLMLVGAVVAIVTPARGIHDRFTNTWIVPR